MNLKRLQESIEQLATFSDAGAGINRLAYTKSEREARDYMIKQFENEGMTVQVDAVGNVIARREGLKPYLPAVATGSHIDSVYDAGKYDGVLGVMAALEVIRSMNEEGIQTMHPIEVIIFACEESSRFGVSTIGSKAMAGLLQADDVRALVDRDGMTISDVFAENGLELENIHQAARKPETLKSFIELHIEQGPILEREQLDVGIVTAIASPTRFRLSIVGRASHSGTTPMHYRHDALLGAAEIALEVEQAAKAEAHKGTVGTVGVLQIKPGGMNIVPGEAHLDIDIRGTDATSKQVVVDILHAIVERVAETRGLQITPTLLSDQLPIDMDPVIVEDLEMICEQSSIRYKTMPSGAGHDAMFMASLCPTGMIFVPSIDGLSHNPKEYTPIEQIGIGTQVLQRIIVNNAIQIQKTTANICSRSS